MVTEGQTRMDLLFHAGGMPNATNFSKPISSFFDVIYLQTKDLSPGNADVLVGLDLPRHISCRRGRQRSQGNKVAEPSRLRR